MSQARTVSVYLDNYVLDGLTLFGPLSEVVDKVLTCCISDVDVSELPKAPPITPETRRVNITVTNEEFLMLSDTYGATSKKVSLRRILYWFVDNAMYENYDCFEVNQSKDNRRFRYITRLNDFESFVDKLEKHYCSTDTCVELRSAINKAIGELQ